VTAAAVLATTLAAGAPGAGATPTAAAAPAAPAARTAPAAPAQAGATITVAPDTGLVDGQEAIVTVTGDGPLFVSQCEAAIGDAPTLDQLMHGCGNQVAVPAERPATLTYAVASSFTSLSGSRRVGCGVEPDDCLLTVSGLGGQGTVGAPIDVAPPPVVARPDAGLAWSDPYTAHLAGTPGATLLVAQCLEPVPATYDDARCTSPSESVLDAGGRAAQERVVVGNVQPPSGEPIPCITTNCSVAAYVVPEPGAVGDLVGEWPLGIVPPPPYAQVSQSGPTHDGDFLRITGARLAPGVTYTLVTCTRTPGSMPLCERPDGAPTLTADANGSGVATALAAQRLTDVFGRHHVCRHDCGIGLLPPGGYEPVAIAGYALADGAVDVVPRSRLADGQVVTFSGTDLQPSYDGPPFWAFPQTGQWVVAQCDAAVVDDVTLLGVFTHCAASPIGPVAVPGQTFTVGVPVARTITRILGGTTDCRASLDACVLVLTRVEQDGSVSLRSTPIAFA
jgi:hypothetical protein